MTYGRKKLDTVAAEIIGKNIKHYRIVVGITQEELANIAGTSQRMVSLFETGNAMPNTAQMIKIAEALQRTVESFVKEQ